MTTQTTYKLIPLSGEVGSQLVDGYQDAASIARRIAIEQQTDVLVFDAAQRAIVWCADGTHRAASPGEVPRWNHDDPGWEPSYSPWRHGGWYVDNVHYPSGAVGCVSRKWAIDRKWRIVCDPREGSYPRRSERSHLSQSRRRSTGRA